jgi:hypothetical protein
MLEFGRNDWKGFAAVDATRGPSFVSPDRRPGHEAEAASRQDEATDAAQGRASVHNVVVQNVKMRDARTTWRSIERLRVTIERFEEGDVIAHLVAAPSFVGHGSSERDAIADMMDEIAHELRFYRDADESTLTSDAKATKEMLAEQFEAVAEG